MGFSARNEPVTKIICRVEHKVCRHTSHAAISHALSVTSRRQEDKLRMLPVPVWIAPHLQPEQPALKRTAELQGMLIFSKPALAAFGPLHVVHVAGGNTTHLPLDRPTATHDRQPFRTIRSCIKPSI
jgi:hypothetical protein